MGWGWGVTLVPLGRSLSESGGKPQVNLWRGPPRTPDRRTVLSGGPGTSGITLSCIGHSAHMSSPQESNRDGISVLLSFGCSPTGSICQRGP